MYGQVPYVDRAWDVDDVWIRFPMQGVHYFESPRLSDMSNCLSCSSQHVDNLMEGLCWNCYNYLFATLA
jgi:hypothetical protein